MNNSEVSTIHTRMLGCLLALALVAVGSVVRAQHTTPGTAFRDCPECPDMVVIPAGTFTMGSAETENGHSQSEAPQRAVGIAAFALGQYEVTFEEWDACVAGGGCMHRPADRGWGRGRRPVILISWDDAKEYVAWLSRKTGRTYRLPSEAEWEYAARAGTTTRFYWGDELGRNQANCFGCGSEWDDKQTAPVGSFAANQFGLHDMHGNVKEWVEDCWVTNSYRGAPSDGSAWLAGVCKTRLIRGGSYMSIPWDIRSAMRSNEYPMERRNFHVGFRVARSLE